MKYDIRCSNCGKFISWKTLEKGTSSQTFIPDSLISYEEIKYHCERCTKKYGRPIPNQFVKYC